MARHRWATAHHLSRVCSRVFPIACEQGLDIFCVCMLILHCILFLGPVFNFPLLNFSFFLGLPFIFYRLRYLIPSPVFVTVAVRDLYTCNRGKSPRRSMLLGNSSGRSQDSQTSCVRCFKKVKSKQANKTSLRT